MENVIEQWLHDKIRRAAEEEPEFRRFLGKEILEQVTKADAGKFQLFQLKKTLFYVYNKSPFYQELFTNKAIKPDDIKSLSDLASLPFTDPDDVAESPYQFLCVSAGNVARPITFTSSGTTGPQKRVFFTRSDIDKMVEFMEIGIRTVAKRGDVVQILLPGGSRLGQLDLLAQGVEQMGGLPIKAGTGLSPDEQLELVKKHKSTVLFVRTGRLYRMTQELLAKGYELDNLGVKTLFLTSEYLPGAMRKRLESIWNCEVSCHYGMSEMGLGVAVECQAHDGFHLNEVDILLEMIDPKTGEVITDGSQGEMVFTTLNREGMPLIRYRTHDISRLSTEPCSCGASTLIKFAKTTHRLESIVKVGDGDEIYPSLFDEVLYEMPEVVDYQVNLNRLSGKDSLSFIVEVTQVNDRVKEEVRKKLSSPPVVETNISAGRMTESKVELVGLGGLKRSGRAKKLIADNR